MTPTEGEAAATRVFRLLVPAPERTPRETPDIWVDGVRWIATPCAPVPEAGDTPLYTCISYSWGPETGYYWFDGLLTVSSRTLAVLAAVIRSVRPPALWLDAFCIPQAGPERAACLRSIGSIYARAGQSVVVLSPPCGPVIGRVQDGTTLDEAMLRRLDADDWVTRAWTYQEIANSREIHFVAQGTRAGPVPGADLLNALGYALQQLKKHRDTEPFRLTGLGNVESLEEVLADWMITGLGERFAYQSMAAMAPREATYLADPINGMIGTLRAEPDHALAEPVEDAFEHFLRVCEERRDYSFIYCTARRRSGPERRWRPLPGPLRPILAWHTYGGGQPGSLQPGGHLRLTELCPVTRGSPGAEARGFIDGWLNSDGGGARRPVSADHVAERLRLGGLADCGEAIGLVEGCFFPERDLTLTPDHEVFIATGVRWVHGAPGLIVRRSGDDTGSYAFCGVGVFVGPVPQPTAAIDLL